MLRLFAVAAPAAVAVLAASGTAAATVTLPLHSAHKGALAKDFATNDCAKDGNSPSAGYDRWVFVLPANDANFVSLSLSYKTLGGSTTTVTIPNAADPYPDGITTNGTSKAWIDLPSGWTLLDGSAVVSGKTKADDFNLTHTCLGAPGTPKPSSPAPSKSYEHSASPSASSSQGGSASPSTSVSGGASEAGSPSGGVSTTPLTPTGNSLPLTGTAVSGLVVAGLTAVGLGASLLWLRRRRDTTTFTAE